MAKLAWSISPRDSVRADVTAGARAFVKTDVVVGVEAGKRTKVRTWSNLKWESGKAPRGEFLFLDKACVLLIFMPACTSVFLVVAPSLVISACALSVLA